MAYNNGKNDKPKPLVVKAASDDMRAFYDFCIDFMVEDGLSEEISIETDNLLNWCEEPEMVKLALLEMKNKRKI